MKAEMISEALGEIDERYVIQAMEFKRKTKRVHFLRAAMAACLCIGIICGVFTVDAYAKDLKYYKEIVDTRGISLINPSENPPQVVRDCAYNGYNGDTPRLLYMVTLTTDKTRYTVDDYIYVTVTIENLAQYSLEFLVGDDRHGVVTSFFNKADDDTIELYDATFNSFDITTESYSKPRIILSPGEFYTQTLRFSAKYMCRQPGYKPVEADVTLPTGIYEGTFFIHSNSPHMAMLDIAIEIIDESTD